MWRKIRVGLVGIAAGLGGWGQAAEPPPAALFGGSGAFRSGELRPHGVEIAVAGGQLRVEVLAGDLQGDRRRLVFPLERPLGDLSRYRHVEVEIANPGPTPVVFTFWALSGPGWGGVSTFSTVRNASGRETLAPGARGVFRVDLQGLYPGQSTMQTIDPAAVRELELVIEPARAPAVLLISRVSARGAAGAAAAPLQRIRIPDIETRSPAPGRRVYQKLPGWEHTAITHVLTLPRDWRPEARFPVIVEYTGNVFYHKYCHSTGRTEQGNLAYGLSRGEGFICLNLPFVSGDARHEQVDGWGDIAKTEEYCLQALLLVEERYGADRRAVFFTGFSRGSYAANYLALRDDRIARVWAGFLTLRNPGAEWPDQEKRGWRGVDVGWNERAARMKGRPWFHERDGFGSDVHVDVEFLDERPSAIATRRWLQQVVQQLTIGTK